MTRRTLKRTVLAALKSGGVYSAVLASRWRRRRLAILCYHGLSLDDEHLWAPTLFIDPRRFEERLHLLRAGGYHVAPLGEAIRHLYDGTLPPKTVSITFDDGTSDFYRLAFPLLDQYKLPATVYLTTFYCQYPRPVFRLFCGYLLWKGRNNYSGGTLLDLGSAFDLQTEEGRHQALVAIDTQSHRRGLTLEERDDVARRLALALHLDYDELVSKRILQVMTAAEVATVAAAGIDIQLHTHRHRTPADRALFAREIDDNQRHIEAIVGTRAQHFCYPRGVYRQEFLPWLREHGVVSATTCESGLASVESEPLLLPRIIDTSNLEPLELEGWLTGTSALLRRQTGKVSARSDR
jgi:peptidoglycan/xylan/chitin deacetylase (PgdA/CDA1 family)